MTINDCFELGFVLKSHGLKGEVSIVIDADKPDFYSKLSQLFLSSKAGLVPFQIEKWNARGPKVIAKFTGCDRIEDAVQLENRAIYLPLTMLPPLADHQYYFHEIIGFSVVDAGQGVAIGTVKDVMEMPQQDMLLVDVEGQEVLIPMADDFKVTVSKRAKTLSLFIPDGLIDLYTKAGADVQADGFGEE